MQTPLQIVFRHVDRSAALEARVRKLVNRLERFHDRITGCRVTVERPTAHRNRGEPYSVRITLAVPGGEINAHSHSNGGTGHSDVYAALRDAFDGAKRQLVGFSRDPDFHANSST